MMEKPWGKAQFIAICGAIFWMVECSFLGVVINIDRGLDDLDDPRLWILLACIINNAVMIFGIHFKVAKLLLPWMILGMIFILVVSWISLTLFGIDQLNSPPLAGCAIILWTLTILFESFHLYTVIKVFSDMKKDSFVDDPENVLIWDDTSDYKIYGSYEMLV